MENIISVLEKFNIEHAPLVVKNMSTQEMLLCLEPRFEKTDHDVVMKFESLNERGGNSVTVTALHEQMADRIYFENEIENMFQIRALNLHLYKTEIQKTHFNAPDFDDEKKMQNFVLLQPSLQ